MNIFTRDPIKIILWSLLKNKWVNKVILVGGSRTPSNVRAEVIAKYKIFKAGRSVGESKILTHWYGKDWKKKLLFEGIVGGDPLDAEVPVEAQPGDVLEPMPGFPGMETEAAPEIPPATPMVQEQMGEGEVVVDPEEKGSPLVIDDSGPSINIDDFAVDAKEFQTHAVEEHINLESTERVFMWDMTLFPEDKITDLKYKINKHFNIPMFRQHLWYMYGGHSYPMKYTLTAQQFGPIVVDFWNQVIKPTKKDQLILGMPIHNLMYRLKDTLKVEAYDNFTLLQTNYAQRGITEYHLVDIETFVASKRTELGQLAKDDKFQTTMLYYSFVLKFWPMMNVSVWEEYLLNGSIKTSYPQLDPPVEDLAYILKQESLMNSLYGLMEDEPEEVRKIEKLLQKSLTNTTLKVSSTYRGKVLNCRKLFDLLECDEELDAIRLYDLVDGRHIMLDKFHWKSGRSTEKMIPGVMYIRVVVNRKPYQKLNIFIYPNASYAIESSWGEDLMYGFNEVNKMVDMHVTPIIRKLNTMKDKIMYYHGMQLPLLDKSNVKYVDISISMFWKQMLTTQEFKSLKSILDRFSQAHLIQEKLLDRGVLTYFFKKGMFELDAKRIEKLQIVDNYYSYLFNSDIRQKWFLLFENIRVMIVSHRFSDLKIEISGIKEDEYYIFQKYIILLLWLFKKEKPAADSNGRAIKPLSNLKEQDPHLYNLKKIYGSPLVYSKICQKPYQPLLMTEDQYRKLPKKDNVVKYFNFTTKTPAYYRCPNPKYPYIRFITGKHPMGYCIPCCKITPPPKDPEDKQRKLYEDCLTKHTYQRTTVEQSSSRYIMSYGKPIDIGRLSNLPESTLDPLFSDTKTAEGEDEETVIEAKYYLFGVQQQAANLDNIGYVFCLSSAMAIPVCDLVHKLVALVRKNPNLWPLLLNGDIITKWPSWREMTRDMLTIFCSPKPLISELKLDWNALFMDLARVYLNLQTIVFEDRNTVIQLRLPPRILSASDFYYPDMDHLIVLKNLQTKYWNPIYVVHKDIYFRTGIIERRLFTWQSDVIQLIMDMVRSRFSFKDTKVQTQITLDVLTKFTNVDRLLLTRDNMCYGVHINKLGFVPVSLSYYKFQTQIPVSFASKDIQPPRLQDLLGWAKGWNIWVAKKSQEAGFTKIDVPLSKPLLERVEPIYPFVKPEKWLLFPDGKVGGFISNGMNWYIQPIGVGKALMIDELDIIKLNYDPLAINSILENYPHLGEKADKRIIGLNGALYKHYMFKILLLEFIKLFNKQKNFKVRTAIKNLFAKADFRTKMRDVQKQLVDLVMSGMEPGHPLLQLDIEKIKGQLADFISLGQSRKQLLHVFDSDYYNFDRSILEKMKQLPRDQILIQLRKLAHEITVDGTPDFSRRDFPNVLFSCQDSDLGYCKNKKLLIPKAKLEEFLNILADQIKNPFVEKYLFSPLFAEDIIDYFKFTRRPEEVIELEFL